MRLFDFIQYSKEILKPAIHKVFLLTLSLRRGNFIFRDLIKCEDGGTMSIDWFTPIKGT